MMNYIKREDKDNKYNNSIVMHIYTILRQKQTIVVWSDNLQMGVTMIMKHEYNLKTENILSYL